MSGFDTKSQTETSRIDIADVRKEYRTTNGVVTALDGLSVSFRPGEVTGLLGPNGAGKTTLLKIVLGLVAPTAGTVTIDGTDTTEQTREVYRNVTAVLEGARNVYWRLTPLENMAFFASLQGIDPRRRGDYHREITDALGLGGKADEPVNDLSRGMKQKVSIACALARETPILVLDEPTLGLDVEASRRLTDTLQSLVTKRNRTVIVSSHDMDTMAAVCDRVVVMSGGEIVADDRLDALLDAFATEWYEITVSCEESIDVRGAVACEYDTDNWQRDGRTVSFRLAHSPEESLYPLLDGLRALGCDIEGISPVRPDLEEIFVGLVGGATADPNGSGPEAGVIHQ